MINEVQNDIGDNEVTRTNTKVAPDICDFIVDLFCKINIRDAKCRS